MESVLASQSVRLRWINCQCFEIQLPNGKTILTDPCYDYPESEEKIAELFRLRGFHTGDLEGCDYVILNHTHSDHMSNLEEVVERFHPTVICHTGVAAEIAETCSCLPLTSVYPVDYNGTYYFDGFRITTYHGTHKPQRTVWSQSMAGPDAISQSEKLKRLHTIGGFFNMNFMITADNGFRIAFVGGLDDGMKQHLALDHPNIAFRNKINNEMDTEKVAEDWLGFMKECHAQIVFPMHFEVWENLDPSFSEKTFARANEMAEEQHIPCRMMSPKRTQWYTISMNVSLG